MTLNCGPSEAVFSQPGPCAVWVLCSLGKRGFCRAVPGGSWGEEAECGLEVYSSVLLEALRSGCSGPDNFSIKRK